MHEHTSVEDSYRSRAARHPVELSCELISHYSDEPATLPCADLSASGVWVETFLPLHRGAEVVVSLPSPRAPRDVLVFGRVARVRTGRRRGDRGRIGMGIAFVNVTASQRRALSRLAIVAGSAEAA